MKDWSYDYYTQRYGKGKQHAKVEALVSGRGLKCELYFLTYRDEKYGAYCWNNDLDINESINHNYSNADDNVQTILYSEYFISESLEQIRGSPELSEFIFGFKNVKMPETAILVVNGMLDQSGISDSPQKVPSHVLRANDLSTLILALQSDKKRWGKGWEGPRDGKYSIEFLGHLQKLVKNGNFDKTQRVFVKALNYLMIIELFAFKDTSPALRYPPSKDDS